MVPLSMHDLKGGFFLLASFVMLALICAIAALGTVMRPQRWCERQTRLSIGDRSFANETITDRLLSTRIRISAPAEPTSDNPSF